MSLQWKVKTDLGNLYLIANEKGLEKVFLSPQKVPMVKALDGKEPATRILAQAVRELEEYFAGDRKSFDVPLVPRGTEFQKKVWAQLLKIPYGKTLSYRDVARGIRNPKAVRAVGSANGKNPLCIIVPCHRVIAADGGLGGYSGGLHIKKKLLKLEAALELTSRKERRHPAALRR